MTIRDRHFLSMFLQCQFQSISLSHFQIYSSLFKLRGHSITTWTRRGGWVVSQMSTFVHVGQVGSLLNIYVDKNLFVDTNFTFPVITFKPFEVQKRTICQNKHLNVINLVFSIQFVHKMTGNRLKSSMNKSKILTRYCLQIPENPKLKNFTFWVITFEPFEIQKRTISQNKHHNLINVAYTMHFVSKMTLSRLKSAIYESQILRTTLQNQYLFNL